MEGEGEGEFGVKITIIFMCVYADTHNTQTQAQLLRT